MKKHLASILIVVFLGGVVVLYVWNWSGKEGEEKMDTVANATSTSESVPISTKEVPTVLYQNNKYSFSFKYPPQSKIKEFNEGQGAMTITVENEQNSVGLQVFVVPYVEKTISEARFHADSSSGIRTNVQTGMVDGVESVTFDSHDDALGDTKEVWFIRGGYLYEVTTFVLIDEWFAPILKTWKFL